MVGSEICLKCGSRRVSNSPKGLCPRCLLSQAIEDSDSPAIDEPRTGFDVTLLVATGSARNLGRIHDSIAQVPSVLLRDSELESGPGPVIKPSSKEMPESADVSGKYQIHGEIARGGMGAVLRGRDVDLGRDLALKVLLDSHKEKPELVKRFIEEAQIGGQLQHPGIVPVYDLGAFADRRPYFTMKLVKGRTMAELIRARSSSSADWPRFLSIFASIAQTMAYAHARGVIHRDLKPSNVMVGSFGEVQVMDWGLAKVLPARATPDLDCGPHLEAEFPASVIQTGRSSGAELSQAGSVLGTPGYMAPEQARGEIDQVDERADVFGLGAMLCEILTGLPAFTGGNPAETLRKAARGDVADALARLNRSGAEVELIGLAENCLGPEPADRPGSARQVSERITAYLAGVQDRLRKAELARVEASARAVEERKRRRLALAFAATIVLAVCSGGAVWASIISQRAARAARAAGMLTEAVTEARLERERASSGNSEDLLHWVKAVAACRSAEPLLGEGEPDLSLQRRLHDFIRTVYVEAGAAESRIEEVKADRRMLERLEEIRFNVTNEASAAPLQLAYAKAFRDYGIDLDVLDPVEAGKRLASRKLAVELVAVLDDWTIHAVGEQRRRLVAIAVAADPDPWRSRARRAAVENDIEELRRLAAVVDLETTPAFNACRVASALCQLGDKPRGIVLYRALQQRYPGDMWINWDLARNLAEVERYPYFESLRFATAAVAARPGNRMGHATLGVILTNSDMYDEAILEFRTSIRLKPDNLWVIRRLVGAFKHLGRIEANNAEIDKVLARYHEAAGQEPRDRDGCMDLGVVLRDLGRLDGAIAEFREAIRLSPTNPWGHADLAIALVARGDYEQSAVESRRAMELADGNFGGAAGFGSEVADTLARAAISPRLAKVLSGEAKTQNALELAQFGNLSIERKLFVSGARLLMDAIRTDRELGVPTKSFCRYNSACAAARAGEGEGNEKPRLDEREKAHWRQQALDWLKTDLAAFTKQIQARDSRVDEQVVRQLRHWKHDPDLASIREEASLKAFPDDEQKACRALWAEVDTVIDKVRRS